MKLLKPAILRPIYYSEIEKAINEFFLDLIFKPMKQHVEFQNRKEDALLAAIRSGQVKYEAGEFSGNFNAAISKILRDMGAQFNSLRKIWKLEQPPAPVQLAQAQADARTQALRDNILRVLDNIPANMGDKLRAAKLKGKYSFSVRHMNKDFLKSVAAVTVAPKLTAEQEEVIAREWSDNIELYIKDFTDANIKKLREQVRQSVFTGAGRGDLAEMIQRNYKTTRAKAKFLATQETSLLLSTFHEARYKDVGVRKYKWSTSHDSHVRHDHKRLDGKVFRWDDPPVVDLNTGKRANPGEDFGCRCVPIPIWE